MRKRTRVRFWILIVSAAIVAHLLLLLTIKPTTIELLRKGTRAGARGPAEPPATGPVPYAGASPVDVISIPVEYESNFVEQKPVPLISLDAAADEKPPAPQPEAPPSSGGGFGGVSDLGGLAGEASQTVSPRTEPDLIRIPPRPLQITWPDTRRLKHCLGHQIAVRIQVDESGRIVNVEAPQDDHPLDCVNAALESARQIVFAPGTIAGKPMKMWTEIRIDFRSKN